MSCLIPGKTSPTKGRSTDHQNPFFVVRFDGLSFYLFDQDLVELLNDRSLEGRPMDHGDRRLLRSLVRMRLLMCTARGLRLACGLWRTRYLTGRS
jgi:hypothetical protein